MVSSTFLENKVLQIKISLFFFIVVQKKKKKKERYNLEFNLQLRVCFTFVHVIFNQMHGAKRYRGKKEKEK